MNIDNRECEALTGLLKLKYRKYPHKHSVISSKKNRILAKIHTYACNPSEETVENISYLLDLPGFVVHKWFRDTNNSKQTYNIIYEDKMNLKLLVMLCLNN